MPSDRAAEQSYDLSALIVRLMWSAMLGILGVLFWVVGPIATQRAKLYTEPASARVAAIFEQRVRNGTQLVVRFQVDRPDGGSVLADWNPADRTFAARLAPGMRVPVLYRALRPVSATPDHPDLAGQSLGQWRTAGQSVLGLAGMALLGTLAAWFLRRR